MRASLAPSHVTDWSTGSTTTVVRLASHDLDCQGIAIPRPEVHLAARFGSAIRGGLDLHVMGVRQTVHRKRLRGGQQAVIARLPLGAAEQVLGHPAGALSGAPIPLEELWRGPASRRLQDRLAAMTSLGEVAAALEDLIVERCERAVVHNNDQVQLALKAAARLRHASVSAVAADLRLSERHLRRIFRATLGVGPKKFAQLARFRQALRNARREPCANWSGIAVAAGYYDQAHLIADFRAIAGATPQALLNELRTARSIS